MHQNDYSEFFIILMPYSKSPDGINSIAYWAFSTEFREILSDITFISDLPIHSKKVYPCKTFWQISSKFYIGNIRYISRRNLQFSVLN
jgi:hypothetical protein